MAKLVLTKCVEPPTNNNCVEPPTHNNCVEQPPNNNHVEQPTNSDCVESHTHDDPLDEVVYNFDFIEDYFDPPNEERQTGSGAGIELSPRSAAPVERDEEKKPLMPPDDYAPLDHPLSLMVYS